MTCSACAHPRVTLHDGTETCSWSEAWRAETEARMICNFATLDERRRYLFGVEQKRGPKAGAQLRDLVRAIWSKRPAGGGE